jgi:hypothetical protein
MQSIDVLAHINSLLKELPSLIVNETETYTETVCRYSKHAPWDACSEKVMTRTVPIAITPKVTDTRVVRVYSIEIGEPVATSLPTRAFVERKIILNEADTNVTSSVNLTVSATETLSVTKGSSVTTTIGGSFTLSGVVPIGSGSASTTINFSQAVNTTTSETEGYSRTVTRSTNDSVSIGPRKSIQYELMVIESQAVLPYRALVEVDGTVVRNDSGILSASQLLGLEKRTLSISGEIVIQAASQGLLRVTELPYQGPEANDEAAIRTISERLSVTGKVPESTYGLFRRQADISRSSGIAVAEPIASANMATQATPQNGPVIGPPDGVKYEILFTEKVYRPTPQCGFNDLGVMNGGVFLVETRQYTNYVNGTAVAVWTERVEIFESCFSL